MMIKLIKAIFAGQIKENAIAARIEIKETSATKWWS